MRIAVSPQEEMRRRAVAITLAVATWLLSACFAAPLYLMHKLTVVLSLYPVCLERFVSFVKESIHLQTVNAIDANNYTFVLPQRDWIVCKPDEDEGVALKVVILI